MSDDVNKTQDTGASNGFDATAFKNDILSSNKALLDNALSTMKTIVDTSISSISSIRPQQNQEPVNFNEELKDEIEALGLDNNGAKAITQLVTKLLNKNVADQESKIINKVNQESEIREKRAFYEQKVKKLFPQFYEKGELFDQAKREFDLMTEAERNSPAAAYNAVTRAAIELGVQPASQNHDANFLDAATPSKKGSDKPTKAENDFASFFGITEDKYAEAKKQIKFN